MKRIFLFVVCVLAFLFTYHILLSQPSKYEGKIVKKITITGYNDDVYDVVSHSSLKEIMRTTVGYPLKAEEVQKDIKDIFEKGKFIKVSVEVDEYEDGVQLRFICIQRPIVKEIEFRGNTDIQNTELSTVLYVKVNDPLKKEMIEKSIVAIKQQYKDKGRFNVVVNYKLTSMFDDKNRIKVIFIIDEGEVIHVQKITLLGPKKIYDKLLKTVMTTEESGFITPGQFDEAKYEMDKQNIIAYYRQMGYLDARIISDKVEYEWVNPIKKEERGIYITIKIYEGEKYYFDKYTVKIRGEKKETVYKPEEFFKNFILKQYGEVFNHTSFMMDRQMINFKYASQGYIFARVIPNRTVTSKKIRVNGKTEIQKYVRIDFEVTEGTQAYVDTIIIKGNTETKDKVIRRECLLKEGELFDARKVQLTREKIYNLGFFKQVNIDVRPGSRQGFMNLIIDVEEQATGTISLGGGYGTNTGFSIFGDVGEKNLMGNGQSVSVKVQYGPEQSSLTLTFTEPWLFDKPVGFSSSVFYTIYNLETGSIFNDELTATYKKRSVGYALGLSYRPWIYYTAGVVWRHAFTQIFEPSGNCTDTVFESEKQGIQQKRKVKFYVNRNSKNNYLNPTSGSLLGMSFSLIGGVLGGDDHYVLYEPEAYFYYSPFTLPYLPNHHCVIELRANASFMGHPLGSVRQNYKDNEWIESEDRLEIGGPETIRGWDTYDSDLPDSWRYVGLFHRILFGLEFRVPIHQEMLWMAFFFDAGSLWSDEYWYNKMADEEYQEAIDEDISSGKLYNIGQIDDIDLMSYFIYSYGLGFRVQIPMMPLRFWFGRKMIYRDDRFRTLGGFNFQFQIGDYRF